MLLSQIVDDIVEEVLSCEKDLIIIYGKNNFGKSTILRKTFDECQYLPKLFQSGCNPDYRVTTVASMISQINMLYITTGKKCVVFLDEIDDAKSLHAIEKIKSKIERLYICTNNNIEIPNGCDFMVLDLIDRYSSASDYSIGSGISPGQHLNMGNIPISIEKKKRSMHSLTITCCEKYNQLSTIFYQLKKER